MLEPNAMQTAARRQRKLNKLTAGGFRPVCFRCGHTDIFALERHHYVNRVHHWELTANACRNCHRTMTEQLEAAGVPTDYESEPTPLDRLAGFLGGLAVLLADVSTVLHDWCHWLALLQKAHPEGLLYPDVTPGQPPKGTTS